MEIIYNIKLCYLYPKGKLCMEKMVKKRHTRYIGSTLIPTAGHSLTIQFNMNGRVIIYIPNGYSLYTNKAQS